MNKNIRLNMANNDGILGLVTTGGKLFIIILLTFLPIGLINAGLMAVLFFVPTTQAIIGVFVYIISLIITLSLTFILGGFWARKIFGWR